MPITCVCSQRRYGSRHYLQGLEPSLSGADVELLALPNLRTILLPNTFIFFFVVFVLFLSEWGRYGGGIFLPAFICLLSQTSKSFDFLSFFSSLSCFLYSSEVSFSFLSLFNLIFAKRNLFGRLFNEVYFCDCIVTKLLEMYPTSQKVHHTIVGRCGRWKLEALIQR